MTQILRDKIKQFLDTIERWKIATKNWCLKHADGPHAKRWLAFFSFAESSFFPLPPEMLFIPMTLAKPFRWFSYALLTTLASALGGVAGFFIGVFFFEIAGQPIISFYGLESEMSTISELFAANAFLAIFSAAFTPIPYKVFTLSAGFFSVNFFIFLLASLAGRGLRYFSIGYLTKLFGNRLGRFIFKYFNIISLGIILLIAVVIVFVKIL